ncbi:unnamed protein product [Dracunculus medinensis]|uniref:MH2 domain-containing protein n=1 Tax=Dracunculus medinensis TaxID=318479 RepID=A0A0N4U9G2_DRAME|nr:unnamed protein product [Dracunculus medinensis]
MMDSVGNQEHSSQLPYRMESSPSLCPTSSYSTDQQRNYLWQQYSSSNQFIVENPQIYIEARNFLMNLTIKYDSEFKNIEGGIQSFDNISSNSQNIRAENDNRTFMDRSSTNCSKHGNNYQNLLSYAKPQDQMHYGTSQFSQAHSQISSVKIIDVFATVTTLNHLKKIPLKQKLNAEYHAMKANRKRVQPQIFPTEESRAFVRSLPPIEYEPTQNWIHITYYELSKRVGDIFKGTTNCVTVDGFCAPSEAERFCLGALSGADRSVRMTNVRRQIGNGIIIYRDGNDVHLKSIAETQIFIQCPNYASKSGDHPSTVYRFACGQGMLIFSDEFFQKKLKENADKGYDALHALQHLCHTRVSFVKGWGQQYKRQTITEAPCWIEIQLQAPLQDLDRVIGTVVADEEVHSYST